jgi:hypothetical protein
MIPGKSGMTSMQYDYITQNLWFDNISTRVVVNEFWPDYTKQDAAHGAGYLISDKSYPLSYLYCAYIGSLP